MSGTDDLASLPDLNEEIILEKLKKRYQNDAIYTYIGDILLAINPFKKLLIYGKEYNEIYKNSSRKESGPHVYALAALAYRGLSNNRYKSQCCVISGESGAGKTESTKLFLRHLMYLCDGNTRLESQILQVNPLMEAFGNSKTSMNDNSSRFGKYIELAFHNNKVVGGQISEYLLEKTRVTFHNKSEQNFHIFYYLLNGLDESKENYFINDDLYFTYLKTDVKKLKANSNELRSKYDEMVNAMNYLAFNDNDQANLFAALIGILYIGNLRFVSNDDGYATYEPEDGSLAEMAISSLLGIDTEMFIESIITSSCPISGQNEFTRNYTLEVALDSRDASAKFIYAKIFTWIISKINQTLLYKPTDSKLIKHIGILDIYGFEHFYKNGFEQLCINLANEQIQYFFNKHIFALEQEEYARESIDTIGITFNDNQPLLDLFMHKNGILTKLDDLCKLPKATDYTIIENFNNEFSKNSYYTANKRKDLEFSINHYAGSVIYSAENFLEKNRDSLPLRVVELLKCSKNDLISEIFEGSYFKDQSKVNDKYETLNVYAIRNLTKAKQTVSAQYKNSLEVLMKRMSESKPLFLRCIKPNSHKLANSFDDKFVKLQLRYCGVLETTRIRKEGYSFRPTFEEFLDWYKYLSPDLSVTNSAESCAHILNSIGMQNWRLGKTKVFLKYYHNEELQGLLNKYLKNAVIIQTCYRKYLARKLFLKRKKEADLKKETVEAFLSKMSFLSTEIYQSISQTVGIKFELPKIEEVKIVENNTNYADTNPYDFNSKANFIGIQDDVSSTDVEEKEPSYNMKTLGPKEKIELKNESDKSQQSLVSSTSTNSSPGKVMTKFPWLFGRISRGQSEELLKKTEVGCFLVRESDSRSGYSLTFKAENRCRHYMIDSLPNGKYIIIGEPRVHRTLLDLVKYYQKNKLSNWDGYLSQPFGNKMTY